MNMTKGKNGKAIGVFLKWHEIGLQSYQHKSFWMTRDVGCLTDGDIGFDNSSRMEPKRGHQWFTDSAGPELFSNKKQAVEPSSNNRPVMGMSQMNISPWNNTSCFQSVSGQFSDRLFGFEPFRINSGSNVPSAGNGNMNMERKDFNDLYGSNCSMGLSMSHNVEDPSASISFGGLRKRESNAISLGSTYNNGDENTISISPTFSKADDSFISMGHAFNKDDGNFISMGQGYNKGDESILSMGQPFEKKDANFITMGPSYDKEDNHFISMAPSYNKGHESFISMGPSYDKSSENFILMGSSFSKGGDNVISNGPIYDKADIDIASMTPAQDKQNSGILSVGHNYNKGDNNSISFQSFHDEPETNLSGNVIRGYDLLVSNQNTTQTSEVPVQNNLPQASVDPQLNTNSVPKVIANPQLNSSLEANSKIDTDIKGKEPKTTFNAAPKNKEPKTTVDSAAKNKELKTSKKIPPNNFPSNVKSLLSTGLLDGVPVKYVSWSREKTLRGTIKGTGYLCSCKACSNKVLNAYEFERHANCKTKHPNNHIYFENGKTIYAVVQELKNTPQEMLFNAIETVTGSAINQKNFLSWKASYEAATRELQRIYGKEEVTLPS
ncbi:AUTOIMMUNE REGULATOR [Salix koriyanagi]|uniref:AUTOIMMUNE REGULATOR n=1 Tax=Salix koriyanagi TaxID=2511006 RepID=A0A9Q0WU08_9ROSI|nr:AUTOIMMUNE REGULATOR [Salix koriyanagi]